MNDKDRDTRDRESRTVEEMEAEAERHEEEQLSEERATRQDLNQGFDTGTHDSTHRGVNWPPSYKVRRKASPGPDSEHKDAKGKSA